MFQVPLAIVPCTTRGTQTPIWETLPHTYLEQQINVIDWGTDWIIAAWLVGCLARGRLQTTLINICSKFSRINQKGDLLVLWRTGVTFWLPAHSGGCLRAGIPGREDKHRWKDEKNVWKQWTKGGIMHSKHPANCMTDFVSSSGSHGRKFSSPTCYFYGLLYV